MRILVSNDDGILARGIRTLAHRLAQDAGNAVFVVAPDRERSATGHALTLYKPLRVDEMDLGGQLKGAWATNGTPSDCVKFAIGCLLPEKPDLVISGINAGANLGTEILYSGTVSAAMEGAILGIPSIAISLVGRHDRHYDVAADFSARLIELIFRVGFAWRGLLNINVPNIAADELSGVAITQLGVRPYRDQYEKRVDPRGRVYYWLHGQAIEEGEGENTDVHAVLHRKISITPISFNMTDHPAMERLNRWPELAGLVGNADKQKPFAPKGALDGLTNVLGAEE